MDLNEITRNSRIVSVISNIIGNWRQYLDIPETWQSEVSIPGEARGRLDFTRISPPTEPEASRAILVEGRPEVFAEHVLLFNVLYELVIDNADNRWANGAAVELGLRVLYSLNAAAARTPSEGIVIGAAPPLEDLTYNYTSITNNPKYSILSIQATGRLFMGVVLDENHEYYPYPATADQINAE